MFLVEWKCLKLDITIYCKDCDDIRHEATIADSRRPIHANVGKLRI